MNVKKIAIAAAVGSFLAAGIAGTAAAADQPSKDKCYGVAKAGKNDCAGNGHSCAGQGKKDMDPKEFKFMSKEDCLKAGGKTMPPAK